MSILINIKEKINQIRTSLGNEAFFWILIIICAIILGISFDYIDKSYKIQSFEDGHNLYCYNSESSSRLVINKDNGWVYDDKKNFFYSDNDFFETRDCK